MAKAKAEKLVEKLLQGRKHANKVTDLMRLMDSGEEEALLIVVDGLHKFFARIVAEKALLTQSEPSPETEAYREWAKERYSEFWDNIIQLLSHQLKNVREHAIITCLKLMESEIMSYAKADNFFFPENEVFKLLCGILEYNIADSVSELCKEILELADLRYFILKFIPKGLNEALKHGDDEECILINTFLLLKLISETMPQDFCEQVTPTLAEGHLASVLLEFENQDANSPISMPSGGKAIPKVLDPKEHKRLFGNAWLEFLRHDLSSRLYKSVLIILQKDIIPNFGSPCLLSDFLTRSFNQGGGIALLSLHGLFALMNEHNLEYPQFYAHLYSTIHPRIFDAKYRSRFFYLLNLFLSSTHLPAYLVAAFAKKLARLCLVAPTYAQPLLVNFILTLIERHPSIRVLINRKNTKDPKGGTVKNDPYVAAQTDPAKCKALESSLWELTALRMHFSTNVAQLVKDIDKGPKQDILEQLEESYEDVFASLCEKEFTDAPMNYIPSQELFGGFEDSVSDLWGV